MRKRITTDKAPQAIGPYSQAIVSGDFVFCSGQVALDPSSGELLDGGIAAQTERAFENLKAVLTEAGCSLDDVVKTTVFLASMDDFQTMNDVYAKFFSTDPPARSTVAVKTLPKNALFEIEAIARISQ
jgi:2-iminobutanoate/2-iminopropanoate deaminase